MKNIFNRIFKNIDRESRFYNSASNDDQNVRKGIIIAKNIIQNEINDDSCFIAEHQIYNQIIDDFAERIKSFIYCKITDYDESNDKHCEIYESDIDEIVRQIKDSYKPIEKIETKEYI